MNLLDKNFVLRAPLVYLVSLVVLAFLIFIILVFLDPVTSDARLLGALSGLLAGLLIAALQFLTQYLEQALLAEYRGHGLVRFLVNRRDTEYYRKLIKKTQVGDQIIVVGVTCNRLLDDFANSDIEKAQDLLEALSRGVQVRLLLPRLAHLNEETKADFQNKTLRKAEKIKELFPNKFSMRYYDFEPSHSIFLAGAYCLVGPIFKNIPSRDTPAITFDKKGQYIKPYLSYIEETWNDASEEYE